MQSIAAVMQERGERYRERIAGVSERVVGHNTIVRGQFPRILRQLIEAVHRGKGELELVVYMIRSATTE